MIRTRMARDADDVIDLSVPDIQVPKRSRLLRTSAATSTRRVIDLTQNSPELSSNPFVLSQEVIITAENTSRRTGSAQVGYIPEVAIVRHDRAIVPAVAPVSIVQPPVPVNVAEPKDMIASKDTEAASPRADEGSKCALCLESLKDDLCINPCGHVFHYKCMKETLQKFKYCPRCRKSIKSEKQLKRIWM